MKKTILALSLSLALLATNAFATDFTIAGVRDMNTDKNGVRAVVSVGSVFGVTPHLSATRVRDVYDRYAVGTDLKLIDVAGLQLSATGDVVYQNSSVGDSGYGLVGGAKVTYALTPTFGVVAGFERFFGQDKVSGYNGNVASVGLKASF